MPQFLQFCCVYLFPLFQHFIMKLNLVSPPKTFPLVSLVTLILSWHIIQIFQWETKNKADCGNAKVTHMLVNLVPAIYILYINIHICIYTLCTLIYMYGNEDGDGLKIMLLVAVRPRQYA